MELRFFCCRLYYFYLAESFSVCIDKYFVFDVRIGQIRLVRNFGFRSLLPLPLLLCT